jgi:hypothetical protein
MAFKPSTEAQAALDAFTAANPPVYMTVGDDPTMVGPSSEASPVYSQYAQLSAAADYERRSNDWGQLVDTYPGLGQLQTAISQYGVDTAGGMWSSGQIHIPEGAQAAASELLQHAQASNSHGTFQQTFGITPEEGVEAAMVAMGAGIASGAGVGEAVAGGGSTAAASTAGEATAATTTTTAAAGETAAATSAAAETVPQVVVTAAAPATDAGAGAAATAAAGTAASAGGTTMPAAVPPSAVDVSNSGLTQTGPGQWEDLSKFGTPAASSVPTLGSIATHLATNVALGLVYNALFGKHGEDSGSLDSLARGALVNAVSNIEPIPVVYGSRRKAGAIVLLEVSGTANEYLNVVVVWCEGPISAINTLYLNDVDATDSRFSGLVDRYDHLGSDTQTADAVLVAEIANAAKWSTTSTLSGLAYTYLRLKWNATAFSGGLPNITADIDGRTLYDPRTATTAFSHNPALAIRDYLTNTRYGRGVDSATMIDDVAFTGAARTCDDLVTVPNGSGGTTTQARYRCDGIVDVDQKPIDNLKALLTACRGFLVFSGGQYKLKIDRLEPITVSQGYESSAWVAGSAAPTGYSLNQDIAGESTFAARTGPYGTSEVVNVCQSLDTPAGDPGPDGGWTMSASIAIDKTKPYLFACFFKRLSTGLDLGSSAYWGLHTNSASDTLNLDGTPNTNPYFLADAIASFMPSADQWYLAVGFVHENGYGTSSASISGIYDLNGNKVVAGGTEFKWPADATAVGHRAYHYYNQRISGEIQQMTRPVVIQCDAASAAATIAALLAGPTAGAFTLNEDNIVGAWSYSMGSSQRKYNRVKARFFDAAQSWQPNFGVWPDAAASDLHQLSRADNGRVLDGQLDLPFTSNYYTACQIAQIETKRSRSCSPRRARRRSPRAARDRHVVPVTHSSPGWPAAGDPANGKLFRVAELELSSSDEVRVSIQQYDAARTRSPRSRPRRRRWRRACRIRAWCARRARRRSSRRSTRRAARPA